MDAPFIEDASWTGRYCTPILLGEIPNNETFFSSSDRVDKSARAANLRISEDKHVMCTCSPVSCITRLPSIRAKVTLPTMRWDEMRWEISYETDDHHRERQDAASLQHRFSYETRAWHSENAPRCQDRQTTPLVRRSPMRERERERESTVAQRPNETDFYSISGQ